VRKDKADVIAAQLADIIENGSDADALRAMEQWTSRVYGKPTERVETDISIPQTWEEIDSMSREQRQAILREYRRRGGQLSLLKLLPGGTAEEAVTGQ
jgi:hypothetical protein